MKSQQIVKFDKAASIIKEIKSIHKSFVSVGVHSDAKDYDNGTSVVEVAAHNEFGTPNAAYPIPERSFIRSTYDENFQRINDSLMHGFWDIALGNNTAKKVLGKIGFDIVQKTKKKMETLSSPANAKSTQKAKGKDDPLINNRHLKNSIAKQVHLR